MRKQPRQPRSWPFALAASCFAVGALVGWMGHAYGPPPARVARAATPAIDAAAIRTVNDTTRVVPRALATSGIGSVPLRVPIDGMSIEAMKGGFEERRPGHEHEAVDILAPRNTPIHAVTDGTIAKLFFSKGGGGNTVYQFDSSGRLSYYYAHLERYADGLHDGQRVSKGDVIGYVGTSGNAPPNTPHLHFAVYELDDAKRWWKGRALDPYAVFTAK